MGDNNNTFSYIVVSDDNLSKRIPVNKSTNIIDFYQQVINLFPQGANDLKYFYFEAYSHI